MLRRLRFMKVDSWCRCALGSDWVHSQTLLLHALTLAVLFGNPPLPPRTLHPLCYLPASLRLSPADLQDAAKELMPEHLIDSRFMGGVGFSVEYRFPPVIAEQVRELGACRAPQLFHGRVPTRSTFPATVAAAGYERR